MHSFAKLSLVFAPLFVGSLSYPQLVPRQSDQSATNKDRADAVKEAFQFAWDGYYTYAFPNDELHPISNGFGNSRLV